MRFLASLLIVSLTAFQPSQGQQVRPGAEATARRIISLMPALTEAVCLLGACERLVATDRHSDWPAAIQKLPKLGALDDTSLEAVIALKPDLILSHPGGRLNERLKALGYPVLELRSDNLQDIRHALQEIERRLKLPQSGRAAKLWEETQGALQAQAKTLALNGKTRVYIEVDSALYAAGPSSYLGELLTMLGAQNIVASPLGAFPKLAPEFVLSQQPELIMQMHSGPSLAQRPGWHSLTAIKQGRLCQWSKEQLNILVRPGPRVAEASALMAACLQKNERER
jgi:iron complex transport system substrate-binding protein